MKIGSKDWKSSLDRCVEGMEWFTNYMIDEWEIMTSFWLNPNTGDYGKDQADWLFIHNKEKGSTILHV